MREGKAGSGSDTVRPSDEVGIERTEADAPVFTRSATAESSFELPFADHIAEEKKQDEGELDGVSSFGNKGADTRSSKSPHKWVILVGLIVFFVLAAIAIALGMTFPKRNKAPIPSPAVPLLFPTAAPSAQPLSMTPPPISSNYLDGDGICSEEDTDIRCAFSNSTIAALQIPTSPQFKAYQFVTNSNSSSDLFARERRLSPKALRQRHLQRFALATLYYSTSDTTAPSSPITTSDFNVSSNISTWVAADGWLTDSSECTWYGCFCTENSSHIIYVSLKQNQLNGTIPLELHHLSHLKDFDININPVRGSIPTEIGRMTALEHLRVSMSYVTGPIPTELGRLKRLETLDMFGNSFVGTIPTELGQCTLLEWINFGFTEDATLTGTIPTELGRLKNISSLYLDNNALSGTIPTELGLLTNLTILQLSSNQLIGSIPTELGMLTRLSFSLSMSHNNLTGTIPTELGRLSKLEVLEMYQNKLSGPIPTEIGKMTQLDSLDLTSNALTNTLPTEIGNLTLLAVMFGVNNNKLMGTIPTQVGLLTNLEGLDLSVNQFNGSIPTEIGLLTKALFVDLSSNPLTGSIPTHLGSLTGIQPFLDGLSLGDTLLTGSVPSDLCTLVNTGTPLIIDCGEVSCDSCGCTCWGGEPKDDLFISDDNVGIEIVDDYII